MEKDMKNLKLDRQVNLYSRPLYKLFQHCLDRNLKRELLCNLKVILEYMKKQRLYSLSYNFLLVCLILFLFNEKKENFRLGHPKH